LNGRVCEAVKKRWNAHISKILEQMDKLFRKFEREG